MAIKKIKVLIVDDSMFMREFIASSIANDKSIEVVGKAANAYDAGKKITELEPDVMTLDVEMRELNGIDFIRKLMPQHPIPIVVVSAVSQSVFEALDAGAVDFVNKTGKYDENGKKSFIKELLLKIKIASVARVGQHKYSPVKQEPSNRAAIKDRENSIIAIGASTGGTEATYHILKNLCGDLPGIVIVQHMPPVFTKLYSERLNNFCDIEVKEATDGDLILPGKALVAPGDYHMQVQKSGGVFKVKCQKGEKVSGHCPSVDVLFESVSTAAGKNALGIILTGMGSDGAKGLLAMHNKGAVTIAQNRETCVVYGMPMAAKNLGSVDYELPLNKIHKKIYNWYSKYVSV